MFAMQVSAEKHWKRKFVYITYGLGKKDATELTGMDCGMCQEFNEVEGKLVQVVKGV